MPEISVPSEVRDAVLRELYRQVGMLDWEELPSRDKTKYYTQWVEDPLIGGELADYYTAEGMRVWIKDGPLKEYARALENVGPFAGYATRRLSPPSEFIREVLGDSWTTVPGSLGEKPMHCRVESSATRRYICWGRPRTFRDLLWASVNQAVTGGSRPLIVVFVTGSQPVDDKLKARHERIAQHCGIDLAYVRRQLME
ncbi:hypothetical protein [Nocardia bovistercoris]|uniref:Uncharacterized protein n=1 Tax=Nocardia bovistercoris TaxID=2785916 RepID=A0A931N1Q1_9NOCA|nr:hypothetical protein [Nocardia bovistercoris]MBH0775942.1 hypothetical protein [Nocardia bovistercoris]